MFHLIISFHFILLINKSPVNLLFYIFHNGNICDGILDTGFFGYIYIYIFFSAGYSFDLGETMETEPKMNALRFNFFFFIIAHLSNVEVFQPQFYIYAIEHLSTIQFVIVICHCFRHCNCMHVLKHSTIPSKIAFLIYFFFLFSFCCFIFFFRLQ